MYIYKEKIKACLLWILYSLTPNNLLFVFSQTITFTTYNWKLNKNSNTWYKSDFGCLHFLKKKWKTVWKTKKKTLIYDFYSNFQRFCEWVFPCWFFWCRNVYSHFNNKNNKRKKSEEIDGMSFEMMIYRNDDFYCFYWKFILLLSSLMSFIFFLL